MRLIREQPPRDIHGNRTEVARLVEVLAHIRGPGVAVRRVGDPQVAGVRRITVDAVQVDLGDQTRAEEARVGDPVLSISILRIYSGWWW